MYSDVYVGNAHDKRFYGIYRGVVADTNDPLSQNRIRMLVPQILGEAVTGWAYPIIGNYSPQPGDGCWVMFEGGDPNFPLWLGAF
jgi:hypothetical protein